MARPFRFGTGVPSTCHFAGGVSSTSSGISRSAASPGFMVRSISRAAAAACRTAGTASGVVRLANVPPSSGTRAVSAMTTRTLEIGRCSSSATHCASSVREPWPSSTFPVRSVTRAVGGEFEACAEQRPTGGLHRDVKADAGAHRAEPLPAVQRRPPCAARRTASTMRPYAPQRQMCPSIPLRISDSDGAALRASSPTASMIMPGVQ